ncbi:UPF0187-domain-containing protein [Lophiostoma macrostomum CBS 122681]|uniref:UPF0187-domain-containing protein n=1 Tax=Lophiostoma macrostomum CBS 122681 TaxID=1314788 RepID=A0A6A6T254_9PLEO|nr:UPF0187-domain-containing protein [Lophiostoma macrostomum CBS 122681]
MSPHHVRRPTYPLAHAVRTKPRRVPLVLRFSSGAIHSIIFVPVLLHALFTALIVYLDRYVSGNLTIPSTIIPSLSIVVGLMLVFRNGTSYDRFWTGRNCLTTIGTSVRNLTRAFLVSARGKDGGKLSDEEKADTEKVIRALVAVLYAIKHNLRAEFNIPPASLLADQHQAPPRPGFSRTNTLTGTEEDGLATAKAEYTSLLPDGLMGYEDQGLGLPLQLTVLVESYIRRGFERGWFHGPQASQMTVQVNNLVDAYGRMETIRTTPIPVAHLIHQKQVLALFNAVLPFAIVDDYGWWSVPIISLICFTLYGIEGIGQQLEDPFGYDKNDIKMDGIIEDTRQEVMVLLEEWKVTRDGRDEVALGGMFD